MRSRILIVEDESDVADAVAEILDLTGYDCTVFYTGEEACSSLAGDHSYDLALLDIMLPGINGFELFENMKPYNIPIIFVTAREKSEAVLLNGGAEDYIVKPFDMSVLVARVEKALRHRGKGNIVYYIRDVVVDVGNRVVTKAGKKIYLQPKEFDILRFLLVHKNLSVSREEIISEIWGEDFTGEMRALDVKISLLRKKLDLGDIIKAIPKYGYRLEV